MGTQEFLAKILPSAGWYFVIRVVNGKLIHQACQSVAEMAQLLGHYEAHGLTSYHACAAYHHAQIEATDKDGKPTIQRRVHKNVRVLKCFWMDLDVEPGNPAKYGSQEAALQGLVSFCTATRLPMPMVISSGFGIHVYWSLENEIIPEQWRPVAENLKQLSILHKFYSDPACTSDPARILRPTGTFNRKVPTQPRAVELVADASPIAFEVFKLGVEAAAKAGGVASVSNTVRSVATAAEQINQGFEIKRDYPPCSARKVADRCAQIRQVRDTRGNVSEPHWYHAIQLLIHSVEGSETIHAWSNGHAGYSIGETDKKIAQLRAQAMGPTLCTRFESINAAGCKDCPFKGKISSPVQLGVVIAQAAAPQAELEVDGVMTLVTLPQPPHPFTRGANGGIYYEDPDGITHKIYEYDFFPLELARDELLDYETVRWRHSSAHDGWQEFTMRSSLIARPVEFESTLRDNHIQPLVKGKMLALGDGYLRELRAKTKLRRLYKSQGWKDDNTMFVLGDTVFTGTGSSHAGFSHGVHGFLKSFTHKGSLDTWRTLTWALGHKGFEAHIFTLLLGFIPPLLPLSGRQGFMACALGESGAGKSTMAEFLCSIWGTKRGAWIGRDDTVLARYQRMGAHCNLPVYMDEGTLLEGEALRDLVYSIPTGQSRASMRADYTLRAGSEWATVFLTSSNESLQDKLQVAKANADAESMRLFEYVFPKQPTFGPIAKMIPGVLAENYGVAGREFIRQLVIHRESVKQRLTTLVNEVEEEFGMQNQERFWTQAVALALYGGALARQWGIIDFDPNSIRPWLLDETKRMRGDVLHNKATPVQIISQYLNEHIGERVVVSELNAGMTSVALKPMREISQRYEKDKGLLFVSRKTMVKRLQEDHQNVTEIRAELVRLGIVVETDRLKVLGAGTDITTGQVSCWVFQMTHPELIGAGVKT